MIPSSPGGEDAAFSAKIQGHVQGVGFRYTCLNEAQRLGIRGWIRNTPQGDVEVWAEGSRERLDRFLSWLRRGPPRARIEQVQVDWHPPNKQYQNFTIVG